MFSNVLSDFDDRIKEVDLFFLILAAAENGEFAITQGIGTQVLSEAKPPSDWLPILKGTAYLVLYNLVEAFVRRGFQEIFETLQAEKLTGFDLAKTLRRQWMNQRSRKVGAFDGSPKQYLEIASQIVDDVIEKKTVFMNRDLLPFSGNIDAKVIREVFAKHGVTYTANPAARDGESLRTVRLKRNSLSHGDESFVECGRQFTVQELLDTKTEVVLYMRGILKLLEDYATAKAYKV